MKNITTTIEIEATAQRVWDVLVDFPSHERWNPFFASIDGQVIVGEQLRVVARKADQSSGMSFTPTVLEVEPARKLRWKGKLFVKGIFDGEHIFELTEIGDRRTRLTHSENFSGLLIPLMGKLLAETEEGFVAFNKALAVEVEARCETECRS